MDKSKINLTQVLPAGGKDITKPYILTGSNLKIEDLVNVGRYKQKVEIHPEAIIRIKKCRDMVDKKIAKKEIMYGVNTGIGEFSEIVLDDDKIVDFQKYLVSNHSAGIGKPAPLEQVRATILSRINVHCRGHSGVRVEIPMTLAEMLNHDVVPYVCKRGSVGACGDLACLAQIALLLIGEGKAFYKGEWMEGKEAMDKAGIKIPGLQARDGLSTINGANFLTSMSGIFLYDAFNLLKQAEIAAAMSLEALMANMGPYIPKLHEVKGFKGAIRSAKHIQSLVLGGDLQTGIMKCKVQDAYSMRATPQIIGTAYDSLEYARSQVEIELNGVCDNPIFFPDEDLQLSGANFQGTPVSVPMEMAGQCITMICVLSERRLNRLTNSNLSQGLPPFLSSNPGLFSGLMLSQYTADMCIVEQKILSTPACIQSIPAAADQEDFVSMGMNTALKNNKILDRAYGNIGIEMFAAAQALDYRKYHFGKGVTKAKEIVRKYVDFLDVDRPLYKDHNTMKDLIQSTEVLLEVEKVIGKLE